MATEAKSPQDVDAARRKAELEAKERENKAINDSRTGVGTRLQAGMTRGKGTMVIGWEAFDESQPATLPTTITQFLEVTKLDPAKDEKQIVEYLIGGYNDANYTAASDPLAEFVEASWPPDAQTQFRLVVRNYSRGAMVPLEDAVALIKPGFAKQFASTPSA
jgi:hypothetical protein